MLNPTIKKGGKLLERLLIISLFLLSNNTYSQSQRSFDDSLFLKKEIDSVLAKHGLKSKGFSINVVSVNQQGGQTAYTITNNYYNDPNYIADSINYSFKVKIVDSLKYIYFFPKKGVWTNPFIVYESLDGEKETSLQGMVHILNSVWEYNNLKIPLIGLSSDSPCSENQPMYIILKKNENLIIGFGDYSSKSRTYFYLNGDIKVIPLNVKPKF